MKKVLLLSLFIIAFFCAKGQNKNETQTQTFNFNKIKNVFFEDGVKDSIYMSQENKIVLDFKSNILKITPPNNITKVYTFNGAFVNNGVYFLILNETKKFTVIFDGENLIESYLTGQKITYFKE